MLRSRYAEDRLAEAVRRGIKQYVLLGAGLDTFAYRQSEWAASLQIFEVDQPASQAEKKQRLQNANITVPKNVTFVAIDFERNSLEAGLVDSSFDPALPTFISWLGVMVYLNWNAVDAVFRFAVGLPQRSEIAFTFSQPLPESVPNMPRLSDRAAELGEPWKTYITPTDLTAYLRNLGFSQVNLPTAADLESWYIEARQDGVHVSRRATIANAVL